MIKVGSAATSSVLGSRDLVNALGLREHHTAPGVLDELCRANFAFVAVEPRIPVLDALYGGRFHAPNPFSFGLAPLASPVVGDITVFGLSHPRVDVAATVLQRIGSADAQVLTTRVGGDHYVDEIWPGGEVHSCAVVEGRAGPVLRSTAGCGSDGPVQRIRPPRCAVEAVEQTAALLAGRGSGQHRSVVVRNAADLLVLGRVAVSLAEGAEIADDVLRSGGALRSRHRPREDGSCAGCGDRARTG